MGFTGLSFLDSLPYSLWRPFLQASIFLFLINSLNFIKRLFLLILCITHSFKALYIWRRWNIMQLQWSTADLRRSLQNQESHIHKENPRQEKTSLLKPSLWDFYLFFLIQERERLLVKIGNQRLMAISFFLTSKVNKSLPETNSNIRTLSISVASQPQVLQSQAETPEQELLGQSTKSCSCWVGRNRA